MKLQINHAVVGSNYQLSEMKVCSSAKDVELILKATRSGESTAFITMSKAELKAFVAKISKEIE
jgi:hypothetical protein